MRRAVRALVLGLTTGIAGAALLLTPQGAALEETLGLGWLFHLRGPIDPPAGVVMVTLDRPSAERLGLPPQPRAWPREIHARLIDRLVEDGSGPIVLNLILDAPAARAEDDAALADAIERAGRVVLFEFLERRTAPLLDEQGRPSGLVTVEERVRPPLAAFGVAARGSGPFPLPRTPSPVNQFWTFKAGAGDVPTLPVIALQLRALPFYETWLELLRAADAPGVDQLPARAALVASAGDLSELVRRTRLMFAQDAGLAARLESADAVRSGAGEGPDLLASLIRVYAAPESRYLNYYGPPGRIRAVPYHRVLEPAGGDLDLAGRVVLVGASGLYETGSPDGVYTVFTGSAGHETSSVEILATAFANLLTDRPIEPMSLALEAVLVLAVGLVMGVLASVFGAPVAAALVLAVAAAHLAGAHLAFSRADLWMPLAVPLLVQLPLALFLGLLGQFLLTRRQHRRVSRAIRYYLPGAAAQELMALDTDPRASGRVVYGVCLATDIERFTALSEQLPPEQTTALLNAYYETLIAAVGRHGGVVTDIVADSMMCVWTAAEPDAALRRRACLAALEVAHAVEAFNRLHAAHPLPTRIGLDAGRVSVGHLGGSGRFAYSVIGDIANTACRLEKLNKELGSHILATAAVVDGLDGLLLRPLGRVRVRGKAAPVSVVEILDLADATAADATAAEGGMPDAVGANGAGARDLCPRFARALEHFEAGRLGEAAEAFEALLLVHGEDRPTRLYLERCRPNGEASSQEELEAIPAGRG